MKLGMLNADTDLFNEIKTRIKDVTNLDNEPDTICDVYFIDFYPTKSDKTPEKAARLVKQAMVLEEAVKRKKLILLFDRYLGLTQKEYDWLKRSNTRFLEPALNHRTNFTYLPFWYKHKSLNDITLGSQQRPYTLGYKGNVLDRIKSFEDYYVSFSKLYPNYQVVYDKSIERVKEEEYKNYGIQHKTFEYTDSQYTIIIGTNQEYRIGYIDAYTFKALDNNCIPLLVPEHRYFSKLGWNWTGEDLKWLHNQYEKMYIGLILEFYDGLERFYPEMKLQNVAGEIIRMTKGN